MSRAYQLMLISTLPWRNARERRAWIRERIDEIRQERRLKKLGPRRRKS